MSKRVRNMILAAVALVAVFAVTAVTFFALGVVAVPSWLGFLSWLAPDNSADPDTTTSTSVVTTTTAVPDIVVLDKSKNAQGDVVKAPVVSVNIQNQKDTYTIVTLEDTSMAVECYKDLIPDSVAINALCESLTRLTALTETTAMEQDEAYGLQTPAATVTVTYHDGTSATVLIGDRSKGTDGYYCRVQGETALYIIDAAIAESFFKDGMQFIGKMIIAPPSVNKDDKDGQPQLLNLWLTGTCREKPIEIITDVDAKYPGMTYVSTYVLRAPYLRAVDSDYFTTVTPNMTYLTAAGVAAVHPTVEQLESFGLADPYSVAAFTLSVVSTTGADNGGTKTSHYNDREHMVLLGNKDENGHYYALVDQYDIIYTLDPATVPWAEMQYEDVVNKLLFMKAITSVDSVSVTDNGACETFALAHYPDKEKRDEQMVVKADGKVYGTAEFRVLYQLMIGIKRVGAKEEGAAPTGEPLLELAMTFNDGTEPMQLSFYPMTASRYLCVTADGEQSAVSIKTVEDFLKQYRNYLNGDPVTSTY